MVAASSTRQDRATLQLDGRGMARQFPRPLKSMTLRNYCTRLDSIPVDHFRTRPIFTVLTDRHPGVHPGNRPNIDFVLVASVWMVDRKNTFRSALVSQENIMSELMGNIYGMV